MNNNSKPNVKRKNSFLYNMKINFDPYLLKINASTPDEFTKGVDLYTNMANFDMSLKKVINYESLENMFEVNSKVGDDIVSPRQVTVQLDKNGDVALYSCNCMTHRENKFSYCRHILSVLLYLYNNNQAADMKNKKSSMHLDSNLSNLLEHYENKILTENTVKAFDKTINLHPILTVSSNKFLELSLNIESGGKSYVVKDMFSLAEDIKLSSVAKYGKFLELNHNINNFTHHSKELAKFVVSLCSEFVEIYGYDHYTKAEKRYVKIPNSQLNTLFDILKNMTVICHESINHGASLPTIKETQLVLKDKNPNLTFGLEMNEEFGRYDFIAKDFFEKNGQIFSFLDTSFILFNNVLYRCDASFSENIIPALEKIKRSKSLSVPVSNDKLSVFYSTVILRLKNFTDIIIPDEIENALLSKPLICKIFLDTDKSKSIFADIIFYYGGYEFSALGHNDEYDKDAVIIRNLNKESELISLFKDNGFIEKNNKFVLMDEKKIFNFISSTLNSLISAHQVSVSETFKKIKLNSPGKFSMKITLLNNLIELNFDDLQFSLSELKDILKHFKARKKYFRLKDGSYLTLDEGYFSLVENLSDNLNIFNENSNDHSVYLPKYRALQLQGILSDNPNFDVHACDDFEKSASELFNAKNIEHEIPTSLDKIMRNYQKSGFKWLKTLADYSLGGILADDMGLGKTLQVISLLLSHKESSEDNIPSIVICPTSLVFNWVNEVEKFAKNLKIIAVSGKKQERKNIIETSKNIDVIVTSYDLLKRDIDFYSKMNFKYCILDEAQYIKNSYTQNASAAKSLKSQVRFAMTGTPIENSLSDLWSIFDFIMPNFLLNHNNFREKYEIPISKNNDKSVLKKLNTQIEPFILRRLKKDVLTELPDKMEFPTYAKMEDKQRKIYEAELIKANKEFQDLLLQQGYEKNQIKILTILTRLRQICCHPSLYLDSYKGGSAKLDLCMHIVKDSILTNHKILIFSQFTSMIDILKIHLEKEDIKYFTLTGKTQSSKRAALIDDFNKNDVPVFLISLKAGGTGLNLTSADIVIHFDPWWNNSVQNQATDRAHRIGQKNKVQVFKLITKDTIEEKIENLQARKQELADSVVVKKELMFSSLSKEDVKDLFFEN